MAESTIGLLRVVLSSNSAQFTTEMGTASKSVSGFDKTAQQAAKSLASMVSSFNGTKAAAEAQKVAQAVTQVGGAAKLTESELNRVRATLDGTIAKFKALGNEVPADIAKVRAEITQLDAASGRAAGPGGGLGQTLSVTGLIGRALPALTFAGAITGIIGLGKAAFDSADQIVTFSQRTGASTEAVQRWKHVADQTGTTLEAFSASAFKLGVNVGNGTDRVKDAVSGLKLSYEELKNLKPEEQFNRVVQALEGVESVQERNRLGVILFGKQFSEIAVAVSEGYTKIAGEANVAGDASVRAAERAGDAWNKAKGLVGAASLTIVGGVAEYVFDTVAAMKILWTGVGEFAADQQAKIEALRGAGGEGLAALIDSFKAARTTDIELSNKQAEANANYTARLAAAKAEVAALTSEQRTQLDAALKLGAATEELVADFGLSEEALRIYGSQARDASKATSELAKEKEKAAAATKKFWEEVEHLSDKSINNLLFQLGKWETVARDHFTLVDMTAAGYAKATQEALKWAQAAGAVLAPSIKQVTPAMLLAEESTGNFFTRLFGGAEQLSSRVSSLFQQAFTGGGGALGAIKAFATEGLSALLGMIPGIGPFISGFAGPIIAMLSKLTRRFADFFRNIFGGPSADEMAGRGAVDAFEDSIHGALTAAQEAESQGEDWRRTVIAIRDAYIAAGRSEEEALRDAERLWASSRQGADAAAAVIEEIRQKMQQLTQDSHVIDIEYRVTAPDGAGPIDFNNPDYHHTQPVDPGFASGTMGRAGSWFKDFGSRFPTALHGVEAVLRPQDALPFAKSVLGGLSPLEGSTTNSISVLPVIMGGGMSSRDIGRQAARYLSSSGLPNDEAGITSAFEAVIDNWMRTYRG
jgi:hypothetical protein